MSPIWDRGGPNRSQETPYWWLSGSIRPDPGMRELPTWNPCGCFSWFSSFACVSDRHDRSVRRDSSTVDKEDLRLANALLGLTWSVMFTLGLALGGFASEFLAQAALSSWMR